MKRSFKLQDLGCANCAAKMEVAINKMKEVENATINFMSSRLIIEADEDKFEEVLNNAQKAITKIERDCVIQR